MTSSIIYSVAVTANIDRPLSYSAEELAAESQSATTSTLTIGAPAIVALTRGALVRVPLGKREVTGVVLSKETKLASELSNLKLRSIQKLLPKELWLTEELVDLLVWAARYYHQPLGKVLTAALPSAILKSNAKAVRETNVWEAIANTTTEDVMAALARAPRQSELYHWILDNPQSEESKLKNAGFDLSLLQQLQQKKLVLSQTLGESDPQDSVTPKTIETPKQLNSEQLEAFQKITSPDSSKPFLLDGVTGSGKTEVYLQAAEQFLKVGKQVLVLVPEIGLIHQMSESLATRFNADIFVYSSESSETEKVNAWRAARRKSPAIFVGTRSTIFLPFANIGMIAVDEEHDLSYKQQEGFRYHARDLATLRSRKLGAQLVLGSATPSLESYRNTRLGNYLHLSMRARVTKVELPEIDVQSTQKGFGRILSEESLTHINNALRDKSQVLIFVNRRGYAPRVNCTNCGWIALCPRCDTALCKHLRPAQLICHHCDYREPPPRSCPRCSSAQLSSLGFGTEQLEQNLRALFPDVDCIRIDRDSTSRKGSFKNHIERANQQDSCILIGTQMLAKGHHLPRLSLAVICEADQGLFSHDYRAAEHLGQLITQVAGRTGRSNERGKLIVETEHPEHPLWSKLLENPYSEYAAQLIEEREQRGLPPYAYAATLNAESKDLSALIKFMELARSASSPTHKKVDIIGPMPAAMERKKDRFRYQLCFTSLQRKNLHTELSMVSERLKAATKSNRGMSKIRWGIDVDPQTMD